MSGQQAKEGFKKNVQVLASGLDLAGPGFGLLETGKARLLKLLRRLGHSMERSGRRIDVGQELAHSRRNRRGSLHRIKQAQQISTPAQGKGISAHTMMGDTVGTRQVEVVDMQRRRRQKAKGKTRRGTLRVGKAMCSVFPLELFRSACATRLSCRVPGILFILF